MERVNDVEKPFRALNDHIVPPHEDEFRVGREIFLSIRSADDEWAGADQLLSNQFTVHALLFAPTTLRVKRALSPARYSSSSFTPCIRFIGQPARSQALTNGSRSPSITACTLLVSRPVRRSFTMR